MTDTTVRVEWGVRMIETHEVKAKYGNEHDAVEAAALVNKQMEEELLEVVKIITTVVVTA